MSDIRLIDANALKEELRRKVIENKVGVFVAKRVFDLIDNAQTIETYTEEDIQNAIKTGYDDGYAMAKAKYERPQDEVILAHEKISYERGVADGYAEAIEENPQGKWIIIDDTTCECPKCKHQQVYILSPKESNVNFCENCGADNRGE